ncbi:hypothetical protein [Campylobacter sp. RM16192]|nr:hypothetical protein [Campylobacter sp. RM16192]
MRLSTLIAIWVITCLVSLGMGQYHIEFSEVLSILIGSSDNETAKSVIWY